MELKFFELSENRFKGEHPFKETTFNGRNFHWICENNQQQKVGIEILTVGQWMRRLGNSLGYEILSSHTKIVTFTGRVGLIKQKWIFQQSNYLFKS